MMGGLAGRALYFNLVLAAASQLLLLAILYFLLSISELVA